MKKEKSVRDLVLEAIKLYGDNSYIKKVAKYTKANLYYVHRVIQTLEDEGIITSDKRGQKRFIKLK